MKKFSLSILAASAMAIAGVAQADAIFYPDGTVVELGDSSIELAEGSLDSGIDTTLLGAGSSSMSGDSLSLSSDSSFDTSVLGAGSKTTTTTTVTTSPLVYVQPNINWDRTTAMSQMRSNMHLNKGHVREGSSATATFNTPHRAGEFSTMTQGQPNMSTNNQPMVVGSYHIMPSAVTGPYYIFSY